jgi:hypothetical protein
VNRKGQVFPTCEPDRVTAEALKRRNNGFSLRDQTLQRKSIGSLRLIKVFKETPVKEAGSPITPINIGSILSLAKELDAG